MPCTSPFGSALIRTVACLSAIQAGFPGEDVGELFAGQGAGDDVSPDGVEKQDSR
jgi:hypothetical protein